MTSAFLLFLSWTILQKKINSGSYIDARQFNNTTHYSEKFLTSHSIFDAFPCLNPLLNRTVLLMFMCVWQAVSSLWYLWPRDLWPDLPVSYSYLHMFFFFRDGMSLRTQAHSDPSSCCPHCLQAGKRRWTTWDAPTMSTTTTALHSGNGPLTCRPTVFSSLVFKIYFYIS